MLSRIRYFFRKRSNEGDVGFTELIEENTAPTTPLLQGDYIQLEQFLILLSQELSKLEQLQQSYLATPTTLRWQACQHFSGLVHEHLNEASTLIGRDIRYKLKFGGKLQDLYARFTRGESYFQEHHNQILTLSEEVYELSGLFHDFFRLVNDQRELVNSLEATTERAEENTSQSIKALSWARKHAWPLSGLAMTILGLIVIIIIVVG